ncbi:MAG: hypothetical protein ACOCPM_05975 [Bacteroidales bacterium]
MKSYYRYIWIFGVFLSMLIILSQCDKKKPKRNPYFGKIPRLFAEYKQAKQPIIQKLKTADHFGEKLKLKKEIEKIDRKYQNKLEKEYKKLEFPLRMPYEGQLETQNLVLQDIYINDITPTGQLIVTAKVKAKKDKICAFMFARFTDQEERPISNSHYIVLTPPTYNKGEIITDTITQGETFMLKGIYNCNYALAYAEKIIIESEQKYFNNN